jgi:predicted dehydrogenase
MVGLGWSGRKMVSVLKSCEAELTIVCAFGPDQSAADFCSKNGLTLAPSVVAVLGRADVDAVILATPYSLHQEQIGRAVAAGKHVFGEKPLAMTIERSFWTALAD